MHKAQITDTQFILMSVQICRWFESVSNSKIYQPVMGTSTVGIFLLRAIPVYYGGGMFLF